MTNPTTNQQAWDDFANRTIPTPSYVYRRRRLALVVMLSIDVMLAVLWHDLATSGADNAPIPPFGIDQPLAVEREADGTPCEEDEPCWDCATMGNLICGPVAVAPIAVVAEPQTTG